MKAIRSAARPRPVGLGRAILSALGMAAIVVGLLAMHSSGAEHATVVELHAATAPAPAAHPAHAGHDEAPMAMTTATVTALVTAAASAVHCDDACMHGLIDCAVMMMTCAMVLAVAALIPFPRRPGLYRTLQDAGARIGAALAGTPLHVHRPDLIVLSISRT